MRLLLLLLLLLPGCSYVSQPMYDVVGRGLPSRDPEAMTVTAAGGATAFSNFGAGILGVPTLSLSLDREITEMISVGGQLQDSVILINESASVTPLGVLLPGFEGHLQLAFSEHLALHVGVASPLNVLFIPIGVGPTVSLLGGTRFGDLECVVALGGQGYYVLPYVQNDSGRLSSVFAHAGAGAFYFFDDDTALKLAASAMAGYDVEGNDELIAASFFVGVRQQF